MTRNPGSTSAFARSARRPPLTVALSALAVLALGACGTAKATGGGGEPAAPAAPTAAAASAASAETAGSLSSPALAQIQEYIARTCPAPGTRQAGPPTPQAPPPGAEVVDTGVVPISPTAGPEVELDTRDWCAANHHEQRIAEALWNLVDPNPAKVKVVLNDLGYPDARIHDLKQSGVTTHFFLDLREKGGRLCLEGTVGGEEIATMDKCVAPATGPFAATRTQY